jgi:hypothetical protein
VLRRKTAKNLKQFGAASLGKSVAVPPWIASDHFMVGWGRVETIPPALLFVDTGLAGARVKLAESVIKEAGIKLKEDKASEGGRREAENRTVGVNFPSEAYRKTTSRVSTMGRSRGKNAFGFHLAGMVGPRFLQALCGDL